MNGLERKKMLIDIHNADFDNNVMKNSMELFIFMLEKTLEDITIDELKSYIQSEERFCELQIFRSHFKALYNRVETFRKIIPLKSKRKEFCELIRHDFDYNLNYSNSFYFKTLDFDLFEEVLNLTLTSKEMKDREEKKRKLFDIFWGLYDLLNSMKIKIGDRDENYRKQYVLEYFKKNSSGICPSCLKSYNSRNAEVDHYFPKSIYSVISIHPFNLVPVCHECNTAAGNKYDEGKGVKLPTSPLDGRAFNEPGIIEKIYLPYLHSAKGNIFAEITAVKDEQSYYKLLFTPNFYNKSDINEIEDTQLKNHIHLYNIVESWSAEYERISIFLSHNLFSHLKSKKFEISNENVKLIIDELYLLQPISLIKKIPDYVLLFSYAKYLYENENELNAFVNNLKILEQDNM